jgi:hypothetical protein
MNLFFNHRPTKNSEDEGEEHKLVPLHNDGYNTNEGSEFLDDALRMEDISEVSPTEDHKP